MKSIIKAILLVIVLAACSTTRAEVFERDLKLPGDGLLTYDSVSQREWLDLSESLLSNFPGTTLEERYQSAIADIAANGLFEGFSIALRTDVIALAESAGIDTSSLNFDTNQTATIRLIGLVGPTIESDDMAFTSAVGFVDELASSSSLPPHRRWAGELVVFNRQPPFTGYAGLNLTFDSDSISPSTTSVWLYRPVPEPTAFYLLAVGAAILRLAIRPRRW